MAHSNTSELARRLAEHYKPITGLTVKEAEAYTRTLFDILKKAISELDPDSRERVSLKGFGNFALKNTKSRQVKNIKTGELQEVLAGKRVSLKVAAELKDALSSEEGVVIEIHETKTLSKKKESNSSKISSTEDDEDILVEDDEELDADDLDL